MDYGNMLHFGGNYTQYPEISILTPEELWNIDTKMDDGMPARGSVIARPSGLLSSATFGCVEATGQSDFDAKYDLDDNSIGCAIMFKDVF